MIQVKTTRTGCQNLLVCWELHAEQLPPAKKEYDYLRLAIAKSELSGLDRSRQMRGAAAGEMKMRTRTRVQSLLPNNMDQGMKCKQCVLEDNAERQRHTPTDYHALAAETKDAPGSAHWSRPRSAPRPFGNVRNSLHWSARYNSIQQGSSCPKCAHSRQAAWRRHQPAEYRHLAHACGLK